MRPHVPRRARFLRTSRHCLRFGFCALARRPRGRSRPRTRHKSRTPRHKNQFSNIAPKSLFARRRREPATAAAAARLLGAMGHEPDLRHGQERRKPPKTTLENSHFYKTSLKSGFFESTILSKLSKSRVVLGDMGGKRRETKERRRFPSSCKNCAGKGAKASDMALSGLGARFCRFFSRFTYCCGFWGAFCAKTLFPGDFRRSEGFSLFPARFAARRLFSALFPHPFAAPRLRSALYARETPRRARSAPPLLKNARAESII